MKTDLQNQIRHLATRIESGQEPVTVEQIRLRADDRDVTEPFIGSRRTVPVSPLRGRPWVVVVATVVAVFVFGALALLVPGGEPVSPADTQPVPGDRQLGQFAPSRVPDGFVLQDVRPLQRSLIYLREVDETWVPSDGGFLIESAFRSLFEIPEDIDAYLSSIVSAVPGSSPVDIGGRPGVIFETRFDHGDESIQLISVLGVDDQAGVFEISAAGMSREEVLFVAAGVDRVSLDEFVGLGSGITWDIQYSEIFEGLGYAVPALIDEQATSVHVALGLDVLWSRLAHADQGQTVITTDTGEVVEANGEPIRAAIANVFIQASAEGIDELLRAYPHSELSPEQHEARVDRYLDQVRGPVLSEEPYVIQASPGQEPEFDVSRLGEELPLVPVTSAELVIDQMEGGPFDDRAAATQDRPVVAIGTAQEPGSASHAVTLLVWFTEAGVTCDGSVTADGMGAGCGFAILSRFGSAGESSEESDAGVIGDHRYVVPLETSVVQIVTPSQDYWQRPIGGYGVVLYGNTVERPTTIIAYDAEGTELGTWDLNSG